MKKILVGLLLLILPFSVNASTDSSEFEISYGYAKGDFCGVGVDNGETLELTNLLCQQNPSGDKTLLATFSKSENGDVLTFEENMGFYLYGGADGKSTIVVNGNNTIDVVMNELYTINGKGTLIIGGIYKSEQATDDAGNVLNYIVYSDTEGLQHRVVDENGDEILVTNKEEFEAMYEDLKENNPILAEIAVEDLDYFINPQYEIVPTKITEEWVKSNITTDMEITYNEDGSVTFSNVGSILETENVIFESDTKLDKNYKLDVTDILENATNELKEDIKTNNQVLLALYDISVVNAADEIVPMKDGSFTIKIALSAEMKEYNNLKAAYIKDGKIVETFDTTIDGNYVVFNTTHLSEYAILGLNKNDSSEEVIENPSTGDNVMQYAIVLTLSIVGAGIAAYYVKKYN